jgi:hypothetical protein
MTATVHTPPPPTAQRWRPASLLYTLLQRRDGPSAADHRAAAGRLVGSEHPPRQHRRPR